MSVDGTEWDRIFAVNVRGAYNITRRLVPGMVERGFGRVVFDGWVADVADLIAYLCREESGYITGATYDVNGGSHIH